MSGSAVIDAFFALVGERIASQIDAPETDASKIRHWVVVQDSIGVEVAPLEDGEPHELLQSFLDGGAVGAAYVTHLPGSFERVLAYVWVGEGGEPQNSDVRQCIVRRVGGTVSLGPWHYML